MKKEKNERKKKLILTSSLIIKSFTSRDKYVKITQIKFQTNLLLQQRFSMQVIFVIDSYSKG